MSVALTLWLLAPAAIAAPPTGDPHDGHGTWLLPPPAVQANMDARVPPAAAGAIFVPAMTDGEQEPRYIVRQGKKQIGTAAPGTKTWVQPGRYSVLVGSGVPKEMLEFEADVVEGRTTFIPVEWGGLLVNVVNERGTPFRGSYELVRLPDRDTIGLGLGADVAKGEHITTWLLRPGKYMILSAGESYRARKNFMTLRLPAGELVQYTVVMDENTGDLLGAGEVDSLKKRQRGPWNVSLILGGSVAFNRADAVVGKVEGMSLDLSGFVELVGGYKSTKHLFYARFYAEEQGTIRLPDRPYLSAVDTLEVDLLYVFRVVPWFGPYVRAALETQMVPGIQDFEKSTDVRRVTADGGVLGVSRGVTDVQLAPPFSPLDLRYGAGGRFDVNPVYWFNFYSQIGVGARHVFARDLFVVADDSSTPELDIRSVPDFTRVGAEFSTVVELRITRWVLLKLEADVLVPFDAPEETLVDFKGTLALRLASFASLNYTVRIQEDPELTARTQYDQAILLRFAYKVL